MIYCNTVNVERIAVHPMNDLDDIQFVEIIKHGNEPMFSVWMDDNEGEEWYWEFDMTCPSDYERVKVNIFDAICVCDTMVELAYALDEIFVDRFEDILIEEDECDEEEINGCVGCDGCDFCDGKGNCELKQ